MGGKGSSGPVLCLEGDGTGKFRRVLKIIANDCIERILALDRVKSIYEGIPACMDSFDFLQEALKSLEWVRQGGMLVVFPAGEVSHLTWKSRKIQDPPWSDTAIRLVQLTEAPVLPVYFEGRNSNLFQAAGLLHPRLRTLLLPRELLKKRSSRVKLRIGSLIPQRRLKSFRTSSDLKDYIRFRTLLLGLSFQNNKGLIRLPLKIESLARREVRMLPQQDTILFRKEVEALPKDQNLLESNEFIVCFAMAGQIPRLLKEVGRLREETFRLAGEGTGKSVDLDRFDNIYTHLLVWNRERGEVVGAYRLGATDEILSRYGIKGLYTHTLFKYHPLMLKEISPALELGRSFVRKEYQKSYSPLLLLWKGIGHYVATHPRYRILLGPVSISNDYHSYSRQLIVSFLSINCSLPDLGKMVKPRKPFRLRQVAGLNWMKRYAEHDLDEISTWISGVEQDGKGLPNLIRQYLKLGGRILSFNVDKKFRNALDGLILVDLARTDPKTLRRYMGDEGLDAFTKYHLSDSSLARSASSLSIALTAASSISSSSLPAGRGGSRI